MSSIQKNAEIILNVMASGNAWQGVQDLQRVVKSLQPLAMQSTGALAQGLADVERQAQRTAGGIGTVTGELQRYIALAQRQLEDRNRLGSAGGTAAQMQSLSQRHADQIAGAQFGTAQRMAGQQLAHDADVDRRIAEAQARTRREEARLGVEKVREEQQAQAKAEGEALRQEAVRRADEQHRRQQYAAAERGGLGMLPGGGMVNRFADLSQMASQGGTLAGAGAIAGGIGAGLGAAAAAANKTAHALEILQHSGMSAASKTDALVREFVPGGEALVRFRDAINGTADKIRQLQWRFEERRVEQNKGFEMEQARMGMTAQAATHAYRARAFASATPYAPVHTDRTTAGGEFQFQREQALLPHLNAIRRAEAEVQAVKGAIASSEVRLRNRRTEAGDAKVWGTEAMRQSGQEFRGLNSAGRFADAAGALGTGLGGNRGTWSAVASGLGFTNPALGRGLDAAAGLWLGDNKVGVKKAADESVTAQNALLQQQELILAEINRRKDLGITLAEKESAVRKAHIGYMKAEVDFLRQQRETTAGVLERGGSMDPASQYRGLHAARMAKSYFQAHGTLQGLPQDVQNAAQPFIPDVISKWRQESFKKTGVYGELKKEFGGAPEWAKTPAWSATSAALIGRSRRRR